MTEPQRSNFRDALESDLVCPRCGAANRPRVGTSPAATYVTALVDGTAFCIVCSRSGPVTDFQLKERST